MKFSNSAPRDCANGDCADVAPQLTALFDGEADDAQTREARAHLLSCPACSRQWLDWTRYRDTFQSEPAPIVPPTLLWRVLIAYRVTAFARPARRRSRLPQVSATPLRGIEAPLPPRLSQHILARTTRKSGAHVMLTPVNSAPRAVSSRWKGRSFSFGSAPLWAAPALALWILMLGRADFTATLPVATPDFSIDVPRVTPKIVAPVHNKTSVVATKGPVIAPISVASSSINGASAISVSAAPAADAATPTKRLINRDTNAIRATPVAARATTFRAQSRAQQGLDRAFLLAINAGQRDVARARPVPAIPARATQVAPLVSAVAASAPQVSAPQAPAPTAQLVSVAPRVAPLARVRPEDVTNSRVALAVLAAPISPVRTLSSARLRSAAFSEDAMRPRVSHLSANGRRLARLAPTDDATNLRVSRPIVQAPTLREVSFTNADNGPKLDELRSAVDDFRASVAGDE